MAIEEDGAAGADDDVADDAAADPELDALLAQVAATPDMHAVGDEDLLLGRTLGRFVVTARLGKGGMGVVYRARDPSLRRDVALKVLPDASSRDPARRARFLREARAAAGLTHPGIAAIHEVGFDEDAQVAYIAMELVDGKDLRHALAHGPMAVAEVERLALQIARALARAHGAGIVHRDLKPENIMITSEGDAKVLDFGLAKQLSSAFDTTDGSPRSSDGATTQEGVIVGTPGYMAPEQVLGRNVDARTDVFSFGVVVLEMLTGKAPFVGDTPMATALAVTRDPPAPLTRDDVPATLRAVIERCLEKEPAARFADARAIVETLASSLGAPVASGPVPRAPVLTQETPSLTLHAHEAQAALARTAPAPRKRAPVLLALAVVLVSAMALAAVVRSRVTPKAPEDAVRALFEDPQAKIGCVPFSVHGDMETKQLGASAAGLVCQVLSAWRWSPDKFKGPAALLDLPLQGAATFPEDPFFTEDGARALEAAAGRVSAVVSGEVHVNKDGSQVTLRVRAQGPDAVTLVVEGARTPLFIGAASAAVRALSVRLGQAPVPFSADERAVFGFADSGVQLEALELEEAFRKDAPATCAYLAEKIPLTAGRLSAMCGHPERDADGLPVWPPGYRDVLEALPAFGRAVWEAELASDPAKLRALAATMRAARKERSGMIASELALAESKALLRAGDKELARTALDVAVSGWPGNTEAWIMRSPLEGDQELALRALTAWQPWVPLWSHRAFWTKDAHKALAMEELNHFLVGRTPEVSLGLAMKLFDLALFERVRALASFHLDRDQGQDARVGQFLIGLHEWGTGRLGAASERFRDVVRKSDRLDIIAQFCVSNGLALDTIIEAPAFSDEVLDRFLLSTPPRVDPNGDPAFLTDLFWGATPEKAKKALAAIRTLVSGGLLARGAHVDLALDGQEMLLNGDAKGAAALWRIHAGTWGPPINALAFVRAGEDALAEQRYRMLVARQAVVPRIAHARLAQVLAKRGALEEAKPFAAAFVAFYERADVDVPALKEMRAIVARAPAK